jgi:hypothetical protein
LAHQDDFAIKNATNIFSRAGKAPSYYSLHALSNGAKHGAIWCRNRQENAPAMELSIVIITIIFVSLLAQPTTPQRANKKPYRHGTDAPRQYPHTLIHLTNNNNNNQQQQQS